MVLNTCSTPPAQPKPPADSLALGRSVACSSCTLYRGAQGVSTHTPPPPQTPLSSLHLSARRTSTQVWPPACASGVPYTRHTRHTSRPLPTTTAAQFSLLIMFRRGTCHPCAYLPGTVTSVTCMPSHGTHTDLVDPTNRPVVTAAFPRPGCRASYKAAILSRLDSLRAMPRPTHSHLHAHFPAFPFVPFPGRLINSPLFLCHRPACVVVSSSLASVNPGVLRHQTTTATQHHYPTNYPSLYTKATPLLSTHHLSEVSFLDSTSLPPVTQAMCYQLTELYSACRCLYYQHAVDRCAAYGRPGHGITKRTILVGYACQDHSQSSSYGAYAGGQTYSDSGYYSNHSTRDSYHQRR